MSRIFLLTATMLLSLSGLLGGCSDAEPMAPTSPAPVIAESTHPTANASDSEQVEPEPVAAVVTPSVTTAPTELAAPSLAATGDNAAPTSWQAYQQSLQRRCETDADCVVKNVGNCCGFYPQCVHREVQPSPATVKAICEREQRQSICGFEEPAGCQCVSNKCQTGVGTL